MKNCAICQVRIPENYILCKKHYEEYKGSLGEEWLQELVQDQTVQDYIDTIENTSVESGKIKNTGRSRRKMGRPTKYTKELEITIKYLHDRGHEIRLIAAMCKVSHTTVRAILSSKK